MAAVRRRHDSRRRPLPRKRAGDRGLRRRARRREKRIAAVGARAGAGMTRPGAEGALPDAAFSPNVQVYCGRTRASLARMPLFVVEHAASPDNTSATSPPPGQQTSFAAADGSTAFSVYEAADAASARERHQATGQPVANIWGAVSLSPRSVAAAPSVYVVEERFDPPVDLSKAAPENDQLSPCLQTYGVNWMTSFIAADG